RRQDVSPVELAVTATEADGRLDLFLFDGTLGRTAADPGLPGNFDFEGGGDVGGLDRDEFLVRLGTRLDPPWQEPSGGSGRRGAYRQTSPRRPGTPRRPVCAPGRMSRHSLADRLPEGGTSMSRAMRTAMPRPRRRYHPQLVPLEERLPLGDS